MIYDCFTFLNELDLLEIRFNELKDVVDYFVLVESTKTFTNKAKELYYDKHKNRFLEFKDKIIHVIVEDMPAAPKNTWEMEYFQRNAIARGLRECRPDDLIIISDVDEIPRPSCVGNFTRELAILEQDLFYYKLNCKNIVYPWKGSTILKYKYLTTPQEVRDLRVHFNELQVEVIGNGGWHFSYLGDENAIAEKIESFSHSEFNNDYFKEKDRIAKKIIDGEDLYDRPDQIWRYFEIDQSYPAYILKNQSRYSNYIKELSGDDRLLLRKEKGIFTLMPQLNLASACIRQMNQEKETIAVGLRSLEEKLKLQINGYESEAREKAARIRQLETALNEKEAALAKVLNAP